MPRPTGTCEKCKKRTYVLYDCRVRLGPLGAKGHWVYLCPACHWVWGLDNDYITYRLFFDKFFETPVRYELTPDDVRAGVRHYAGENPHDEWKIIILGEIAAQFAILNQTLKELLDRRKANEPSKDIIRLAPESDTFMQDMEDQLGKDR